MHDLDWSLPNFNLALHAWVDGQVTAKSCLLFLVAEPSLVGHRLPYVAGTGYPKLEVEQ